MTCPWHWVAADWASGRSRIGPWCSGARSACEPGETDNDSVLSCGSRKSPDDKKAAVRRLFLFGGFFLLLVGVAVFLVRVAGRRCQRRAQMGVAVFLVRIAGRCHQRRAQMGVAVFLVRIAGRCHQ